MLNKIIFIVGPTAVGKSRTAFFLSKAINSEIVSCDAMQVYKELSVVSDKPSTEMLQEIKHHLVNIISVEDEFDVARFNELALKSIHEMHSKAMIPIIVGGSGMYMQVLLDGIFDSQGKDEGLRQRLRQEAEQHGEEYLYVRLQTLDPSAAEKIHPNDQKRIIRALEVCLIEQRPISELQKQRKGLWGKFDVQVFGLSLDREILYSRINDRVDAMFQRGVIEEIRGLDRNKLSYSASRVIGVREIFAYLDGEIDLQTVKETMKMNTRRFAKRQMTWFRKEKRIQWIDLSRHDTLEEVAEQIKEKL